LIQIAPLGDEDVAVSKRLQNDVGQTDAVTRTNVARGRNSGVSEGSPMTGKVGGQTVERRENTNVVRITSKECNSGSPFVSSVGEKRGNASQRAAFARQFWAEIVFASCDVHQTLTSSAALRSAGPCGRRIRKYR
jgi:hypothetical protein